MINKPLDIIHPNKKTKSYTKATLDPLTKEITESEA